MDQIIAEIKKISPVTRFICGSSLVVTVASILNVVYPATMIFNEGLVFKKLEIWRLYTAFFMGSPGLAYVFELIMLYNVSIELENKSYFLRFSDYAYQLLWVCAAIVGVTWPFKPVLFTRPFLISLVYLYSRLAAPGTTTSIMGLVTIPIWYYPYVLIAFDLLTGGPQYAALSVAGAIVGHVWWWTVWGGELASQGLLSVQARAPEWLRNLMGESGPRVQPQAAGGHAEGLAHGGVYVTAPRRSATSGSTQSSTTGYNWGSGRRLGQ